MLPQERYEKILEILESDGIVKVNDIMAKFNVSIETARRDFAYMEKSGLLKRIYGGALPVKKTSIELSYDKRKKISPEEKKAIGKKCSEFIYDNDTILLDIGTTALEVARHIKNKKNLTVITNSYLIINELIDTNVRIFVLGGYLRNNEGSMSGPISLFGLEQFNVDKAIIGAGGITINNGISDYHVEEAIVRRRMTEKAQKIIVVAEPTKFLIDSFANVCPIENVDMIITSWKIDANIVKDFSQHGVNMVIAEKY